MKNVYRTIIHRPADGHWMTLELQKGIGDKPCLAVNSKSSWVVTEILGSLSWRVENRVRNLVWGQQI